MVKVGKRQKMIINNFSSVGAYLDGGTDSDEDNILLPNNELEDRELEVGDEVDVLIYRDSEDRLIATFRKTEVLVGKLAKLKVTDFNPKLGAFLDWGLNKDILLPLNQMETKVEVGKEYLVGVYEDNKGRVTATMKVYNFLLPSNDINQNDFVSGTVYRINPEIGVFVAVEDRYFGLIPRSECFKEYEVGELINARVIRVREDKKLDLSGREIISNQITKDSELILEKMRLLKEDFRFTDNSDPKEILSYFNFSKKAFKRAMGNLLKNELVTKDENGRYNIKK